MEASKRHQVIIAVTFHELELPLVLVQVHVATGSDLLR
jgi:hypothetical protein